MDQAGLHNISVAQDRDQGVVTLTGKVAADGDKAKADSIANSMAGGQVVADEIAVLPPGRGKTTRVRRTQISTRRLIKMLMLLLFKTVFTKAFATTSRMVS